MTKNSEGKIELFCLTYGDREVYYVEEPLKRLVEAILRIEMAELQEELDKVKKELDRVNRVFVATLNESLSKSVILYNNQL